MIDLGVNIDHVATLRQQRRGTYPDPIKAALLAEQAGADAITLHLREDRRHILDKDVYEYIVDKAIEFKLGARGLRSIVEAIMIDAMFSLPSEDKKKLHVTREYAVKHFEKSDFRHLRVA